MSLAKKAAAGFLWSTAAALGARLITIVSTFILTRYLTPEAQGEVNLANVLVLTAGYATALGVGQFITANPTIGRDVAFHGNVLVLGTGVIACTGCVLTGPLFADWLDVPGMAQFVPGLAISHFLDRCAWLPRAILLRDLRFRTVGFRVAVGELTFAISTVAFAYMRWGGFAIVGGNLVRGAVTLVLAIVVTDRRDYFEPCRLAWGTFKRILRFGLPITVAALFHVGASNWDNTYMGWRFGERTVGLYNQGYRIADLPATHIGEQINDVLVPTFARLEGAEARRAGLLRACGLMAVLVFPMSFGLGAVSLTMVEAFYPPAYQGVAPYLTVLAVLSLPRSLGSLAGGFLQVVNRTGSFIIIDFILVVSVLGIMALLSPLGPVWSAIGVGLAFMLSVVLTLIALRPDKIWIRHVVGAVIQPFLACVPMVAAVIGARFLLQPTGLPAAVRLLGEVIAGAVTYVGASFLFSPKITKDFIQLGVDVLRRRRAKKADDDVPTAE